MREAILVTGLKTQRVRCGKEVEYQIYDPLFATDGNMLCPTETVDIQSRIVPVSEIWRNGNPKLYIAYSHEVEELLGVPINAIIHQGELVAKRANRLEVEVDSLKGMTRWQHIKAALRRAK